MRWEVEERKPTLKETRRKVKFAWTVQIMQAKKVWLEFYIQNQIWTGSKWEDTSKELACWYY